VGLVAAGCRQSEEITAYDEDRPGAAIKTPKNRILAALFFRADDLWTFKLVGPEAKIRDLEGPFKTFLLSVHFDDKGKPEWKLPADGPKWVKMDKAESRFEGFQIGPKDDDVELTVVKLDRGKDRDTALLANVNRWRGQLALSKIGFDDMTGFVRPFDEQGAERFFLVDLTGPGSGRTAPGAMALPGAQRRPGADLLRDREPVTYGDLPKGWQEVKDDGPRNPLDQSRAKLAVGEGDAKAIVSITPFDKKQFDTVGLLRNVNRWRVQQLGLPAITEKELSDDVQFTNVTGTSGSYFDRTGTGGPDAKRMLVLLIQDRDKVWIIKMFGPAATVRAEKDAFERFARSVKFPGGR
jgi:hypothetical protein